MHTNVRIRLAAVLLAASTAAACSTDRAALTAPAAQASVVGAGKAVVAAVTTPAIALTRKQDLDRDLYASVHVDPRGGGHLEIKEAGLSVRIPPQAVSRPMVLWVKARAGDLVAYEFGPHGTQFLKPLEVTQRLRPTSWYKLVDRSRVEVGYFKHASQIDERAGTAQIDEFLPIQLDTRSHQIEFEIHHFSGYLLSTGRKTTH